MLEAIINYNNIRVNFFLQQIQSFIFFVRYSHRHLANLVNIKRLVAKFINSVILNRFISDNQIFLDFSFISFGYNGYFIALVIQKLINQSNNKRCLTCASHRNIANTNHKRICSNFEILLFDCW